MMNPEKYDLVVVGGGVIGLSCLLHIMVAHPGLKAAVLDAPTNPGVASRAAAGMLAPLAEFCEDGPLFRDCMESWDYYPEFLGTFCRGGPAMERTSILIPASGPSLERAARHAEFAAKYGAVEELDASRLSSEEPALVGGRCTRAFRIPGALINPRKLHDALLAEAKRRGAVFIQRHLKAVEFDGRHLCSLILDDQRELVPVKTLLATGAWSHHVGELFGLHLDCIPVKGQVARIAVPEGFLRHIVHEHEIYLAPRCGEGIVIGATMEDVGFSSGVDRSTNEDLLKRARELAPELEKYRICDSWIGFRPRLRDAQPLMGLAGASDNLLVALGHFRNGILLTPLTGRRLARAFDCS